MDMKHVKYLALVLCIGNLSPVMAQTASKSLTVDNLVAWQRISGQSISDNGKWVACKMEPWEGDAVVNLYDAQGKELATFPRADRFLFLGLFRLFGCVAETRQDDSGFSENKENKER